MRDEPADLTRELVATLLERHWDATAVSVTYAPVGFGSHHWIAADRDGPRWFVTADHLAPGGGWRGPTPDRMFQALTAAATSVRHLAGDGYEFAVAALPDRDGLLVRRVLPGWAMQVFPYLTGHCAGYGSWDDPAQRRQIAGIVGRLHAAAPPATLRRWEFALPGRDKLTAALDDRDRQWSTGPYAEATRDLLRDVGADVQVRLRRYDALVAEVESAPEPWVVTHGEPHPGNVIRTEDGRMHLIDWDTVQLAPRERDLATVLAGGTDALPAYQETAGPFAPRPAAVELFRLWWDLGEICGYVGLFREPHQESADIAASWRNLRHYALANRES